MKYLSARCESLQQYREDLNDWQDQLSGTTRELGDHLDRLEAFSRRNDVRFFNVHEGPGEDYKSCVRKVVQLLNRFYPHKTWGPEDVERVHCIEPKRKEGSAHARMLHVSTHSQTSCLSWKRKKPERTWPTPEEPGWPRILRPGNRTNYRVGKNREESLIITNGTCTSRKNIGLHIDDPRPVKLGVNVNGPISII